MANVGIEILKGLFSLGPVGFVVAGIVLIALVSAGFLWVTWDISRNPDVLSGEMDLRLGTIRFVRKEKPDGETKLPGVGPRAAIGEGTSSRSTDDDELQVSASEDEVLDQSA